MIFSSVLFFCAVVFGNPLLIAKLKEKITDLEADLYATVKALSELKDEFGLRKLAEMYEVGTDHVKENKFKALQIYVSLPDAKSKFKVGYFCEMGIARSIDYDYALLFYARAADLGNPSAMLRVGRMLQNGIGISKNEPLAVQWYRKAAHFGDPDAMNHLALMLQNGNGISKNEPEAAYWYQKAADLADLGDSVLNLGDDLEDSYSATLADSHATLNLDLMLKGHSKEDSHSEYWYKSTSKLGNSMGHFDYDKVGATVQHAIPI